jgi:hypothetical protein
MQHVLTLRKTILIFGFVLAVFGCDTDNAQLPNANKEVWTVQYSYNANGKLSAKTEYEYDSNGNLTKLKGNIFYKSKKPAHNSSYVQLDLTIFV